MNVAGRFRQQSQRLGAEPSISCVLPVGNNVIASAVRTSGERMSVAIIWFGSVFMSDFAHRRVVGRLPAHVVNACTRHISAGS